MARKFICGFETGDFSECGGSAAGTSAVQGTTVRSGAYAAKFSSGANGYRESKTGFNLATAFARFYVCISANPTAKVDFFGFDDSADVKFITKLKLTTSGTIETLNGSTGSDVSLGTGTAVLTTGLGNWNLIEVKTVVSAGSGIVEVKVNGVTDQTYTGLTNNAAGNIDRIQWGPSGGNPGIDEYYDDISVDDTAYCGDGKIIARQPKTGGTPTYDQYTKSSGTDGGALWDNTPFTTTDFCSDATNAHAQTGVISLFSATQTGHGTDIVGSSDTVNAVKVAQVAKTSATTSSGALASIRRRVNGTDTDTSISLTTADAYYETAIFTTTAANLDLLEAGAVHGNSTRTHTIEDVWVIVEYTPVSGVNVSLTGNSITISAGTLAALNAISQPNLTGNAMTMAAGTITASAGAPLTGASITFSPGALTPSLAKTLTGVSATASAGSLFESIAVSLTGASVAASAGGMAALIGVPLPGASVTASAGLVTASIAKTLTGAGVAASPGAMAVSLAAVLSGAAVTTSPGSIAAALLKTLTGAAVTASTNALSDSLAGALSGASVTASPGALAAAISLTLTGAQAQAQAGAIAALISKGLTGAAVTASAGSIGIAESAILPGASVTASPGTMVVDAAGSTNVAVPGASVAASAGLIRAATSAALSGAAVTANAGTLAASLLKTLTGGAAVTVSPGVLGTQSSPQLAGASIAASAGSLQVAAAFTLTGDAVVVTPGAMFVRASSLLSGESVTASAGALSRFDLGVIGGAECIATPGEFAKLTAAGLIGAAAQAQAGLLFSRIGLPSPISADRIAYAIGSRIATPPKEDRIAAAAAAERTAPPAAAEDRIAVTRPERRTRLA